MRRMGAAGDADFEIMIFGGGDRYRGRFALEAAHGNEGGNDHDTESDRSRNAYRRRHIISTVQQHQIKERAGMMTHPRFPPAPVIRIFMMVSFPECNCDSRGGIPSH